MKLTSDNKIWIPDADGWSSWSLKYEQGQFNKIKKEFKGNIAIDVGAHVGIWTLRLSKYFGQVICFEPLLKHIECHNENCKSLNNVILNEVALSNTKRFSVMKTMDNNSGRSSLDKKFRIETEDIMVKTDILDNYEFDKIDFIKIDVEGHELKMLEGGIKTIKKYNPDIFIETWPKNKKLTFEFLEDIGYSLFLNLSSTNYYFKHKKGEHGFKRSNRP